MTDFGDLPTILEEPQESEAVLSDDSMDQFVQRLYS